ncbi:hypothetical protein MCOR06_002491 [Pyricularia oryzae]|uniref:Uncharacterized protein n=1 Tax=Pyricularia oryzae TaxID=318829 RepID=A0A4P7N9H4_PYROR|nr:hypothetical protein MCOR06_002491 [Pyricularia oryzae]QBZ57656.1 hypothetical protein PoMZ_02590 [Pyricularia oryzae]
MFYYSCTSIQIIRTPNSVTYSCDYQVVGIVIALQYSNRWPYICSQKLTNQDHIYFHLFRITVRLALFSPDEV